MLRRSPPHNQARPKTDSDDTPVIALTGAVPGRLASQTQSCNEGVRSMRLPMLVRLNSRMPRQANGRTVVEGWQAGMRFWPLFPRPAYHSAKCSPARCDGLARRSSRSMSHSARCGMAASCCPRPCPCRWRSVRMKVVAITPMPTVALPTLPGSTSRPRSLRAPTAGAAAVTSDGAAAGAAATAAGAVSAAAVVGPPPSHPRLLPRSPRQTVVSTTAAVVTAASVVTAAGAAERLRATATFWCRSRDIRCSDHSIRRLRSRRN